MLCQVQAKAKSIRGQGIYNSVGGDMKGDWGDTLQVSSLKRNYAMDQKLSLNSKYSQPINSCLSIFQSTPRLSPGHLMPG